MEASELLGIGESLQEMDTRQCLLSNNWPIYEDIILYIDDRFHRVKFLELDRMHPFGAWVDFNCQYSNSTTNRAKQVPMPVMIDLLAFDTIYRIVDQFNILVVGETTTAPTLAERGIYDMFYDMFICVLLTKTKRHHDNNIVLAKSLFPNDAKVGARYKVTYNNIQYIVEVA